MQNDGVIICTEDEDEQKYDGKVHKCKIIFTDEDTGASLVAILPSTKGECPCLVFAKRVGIVDDYNIKQSVFILATDKKDQYVNISTKQLNKLLRK